MQDVSRRNFLKAVGGASGLLLFNISNARAFINNASFRNPLTLPSDRGMFGLLEPSAPFTLTALETEYEILPHRSTQLLAYEAEVGGRQYINPILKIEKGNNLSSLLVNHLQESTTIHWHGLHVDHKNDGHPVYQIQPLDEYPYDFSVQNRAATYWYHTHAHRRTAFQAYYGLASLFIVEDEDERRLTGKPGSHFRGNRYTTGDSGQDL